MRVLLVEDDEKIAAEVAAALAGAGFEPETERDGQRALRRGAEENLAAIVLDLGLPSLDGLSILKRWRETGLRTPILVLTARGSWIERVHGIESGADDYLTKPFYMEELIARLRGLIRRTAELSFMGKAQGALQLDRGRMQVSVNGHDVPLTPHEFRALDYLLAQQGRVVSVDELVHNVQGEGKAVKANAVEALIGRIRRKVGPGIIETRRGFGYLISARVK